VSNGKNLVILLGNLGKDPEVRYAQAGTAVCNLRLAVSERRKDGDQWKDHTEWVDVVVFGKTAENAGQYLAKGRQVLIEGRLQTRSYKDKEGAEKWKTEVVAQDVIFIGGADKGLAGAPVKPKDPAPVPAGAIADDLPF
jgi:single-strand DNA-binding protein